MLVRTPEDLVAFAPQALGFLPDHSVVMLTFGGLGGSFHARCGLPETPEELDALVGVLLEPARQHRVEAVAFLVYDDDTTMADEVAWTLRDTFVDEDITVLEILRVHDDHWFAVLPGHAPALYRGVPYDLSSHPFTARAVLEGRVTLSSRDALRATLDADDQSTTQTADALEVARPLEPGELQALVAGHLAGQSSFTVDELAAVALTVRVAARRDEAWSWLTRELATPAVALWTDALRRTPASHAASVAAVLAFTAWLSGDGALAWCAVDRCRAVDSAHSLAELVAGLLESATSPQQWALVREELGQRHGPAA